MSLTSHHTHTHSHTHTHTHTHCPGSDSADEGASGSISSAQLCGKLEDLGFDEAAVDEIVAVLDPTHTGDIP